MVDFQHRDTRRAPMADREGEDEEGAADHGAGTHDHDHHAHDIEELGIAIVTVSSSRSLDDDPSGDTIADTVEAAAHEVVTRELVPDEFDRVQRVVDALAARNDVDVVVTTGGTGVSPDDVTIEAVSPLLDKTLPGFGELFRRRSEAEIGTRAIATRAAAGIADGVLVFCLPGSENAAMLGTSDLIVPEAGHLAGLANPRGGTE